MKFSGNDAMDPNSTKYVPFKGRRLDPADMLIMQMYVSKKFIIVAYNARFAIPMVCVASDHGTATFIQPRH